MRSFALAGLLSLLCSCAGDGKPDLATCGATQAYTAAAKWRAPIVLTMTGYTGATGGVLWVDGKPIKLGPELSTTLRQCKAGSHDALLRVDIEGGYELCERGTFECE